MGDTRAQKNFSPVFLKKWCLFFTMQGKKDEKKIEFPFWYRRVSTKVSNTTVFVKKKKVLSRYLCAMTAMAIQRYTTLHFFRVQPLFAHVFLTLSCNWEGRHKETIVPMQCLQTLSWEGAGRVQAVRLSVCATLRHRVLRRKVITSSWIWPRQRRRRRLRNNCFPVPPFPIAGPCQENMASLRNDLCNCWRDTWITCNSAKLGWRLR